MLRSRSVRRAVYGLYARRLRSRLTDAEIPRHVAMVMDGNRRWARQMGFDNPSEGHRHGAEHVDEVLDWCVELGINRATIFLASTDNLRKRTSSEVEFLMKIIEDVVAEQISRPANPWRLHLAGRLDGLPDSTRNALKLAAEETRDRDAGFDLTVAVGYDGRDEIVDAIRSFLDHEAQAGASLDDVAQRLTADDIAAHLYTSGQPDPDLVIRTSGEMRMSGFLLWQTAYSELYFCDVYWPDFRRVDFLRALRSYAARSRRFGA
ncbi:polyprenyl diphosphate synthase [Streptomyces sp. SID3343]|uniref:polyprenyl diphosphate synthase n=1 Tax=Streptomyces sp. SID3343 TaxID=2690260 RepID=UPI001367E80A|nr:polyprenyl diphosphate synthase [Streptomyces sp. SID3343]MYV99101.1 di-trans,poly-cis-decaprenylcistransferase [Streptomyces sp. SID3343]